MKKFLLAIIVALISFSSCQKYDNTIQAVSTSQSPIGYDTTKIVNGHPTPVYDTLYTVSPTWSQAWKWSGQRNNHIWFWLGLVIIAVTIGVFIYITSNGNTNYWTLVFPAIAILVGGPMTGGSVEWEKWNMDQNIPKKEYKMLIEKDGDLHEFWDQVRIK